MRRRRLSGLVAIAALAITAPVRAQEPGTLLRAEDSATVRGQEVTEGPGRLRLFLNDTVLSPALAPRLAVSAALDQRDGSRGPGIRAAKARAATRRASRRWRSPDRPAPTWSGSSRPS